MSERAQTKSPSPTVVEIDSGDEIESPVFNSTRVGGLQQNSVIEVGSDLSGDEDVEIVAENNTVQDSHDVEFVGQTNMIAPVFEIQFPGGPPSRRWPTQPSRYLPGANAHPRGSSFLRNSRRRLNPSERTPGQFTWTANPLFVSSDDLPAVVAAEFPRFRQYFQAHMGGEVSSAIMERISREEESSLDRKIESESRHNRKTLEKKKEIAGDEIDGYTNDISPGEDIMCELCGVVLGEGIPPDFEPDPKYDANLEAHASASHVIAPWFCVRQCFPVDRQLSKRVFAAKCGHVFCGRCIKNIGNRAPIPRGKKPSISILSPQISAPRKCPAEGCGILFSKSKFLELFL